MLANSLDTEEAFVIPGSGDPLSSPDETGQAGLPDPSFSGGAFCRRDKDYSKAGRKRGSRKAIFSSGREKLLSGTLQIFSNGAWGIPEEVGLML